MDEIVERNYRSVFLSFLLTFLHCPLTYLSVFCCAASFSPHCCGMGIKGRKIREVRHRHHGPVCLQSAKLLLSDVLRMTWWNLVLESQIRCLFALFFSLESEIK